MKIFVPLSDEMLDQLGEKDRLVPYQAGLALLSQCSTDGPKPDISPGEAPERLRSSPPILQPCLN